TVSTGNGGSTGLVPTLAVELAPVRVNGIHPGIVGDSPHWAGKPASVLEAGVGRPAVRAAGDDGRARRRLDLPARERGRERREPRRGRRMAAVLAHALGAAAAGRR